MAARTIAPTSTFGEFTHFQPTPGSVYLYAHSSEQRSLLPDDWRQRNAHVDFFEVTEQSEDFILVRGRGSTQKIALRSDRSGADFFEPMKTKELYIDITGMTHRTWSSVVRSALSSGARVLAVYTEPKEYAFSRTPTEGEIYDLSDKIEGIAPLPGFADLTGSAEEELLFIPFLGFEGARFAHLLEQVQPKTNCTIPVVGLPGFRPAYPFDAVWGNKAPLLASKGHRRIQYAAANCPFAAFAVLKKLAAETPKRLIVAPIGTKPHALGVILFWISNQTTGRSIEIIYDHPIRKPSRTDGARRVSVYDLSAFLAQ
jgi:hypothetical protein